MSIMANYDNFIEGNNLYAPYADDIHMRHIYENIICDNENRIKMAVVSDVFKNQMPALQVCNKEISEYAAQKGYALGDEKNKLIEAMVQESLRPLGYAEQNDIKPHGGEECFFQQACWYAKENPDKADEKIVIQNIRPSAIATSAVRGGKKAGSYRPYYGI